MDRSDGKRCQQDKKSQAPDNDKIDAEQRSLGGERVNQADAFPPIPDQIKSSGPSRWSRAEVSGS